MCVFVYLFVLLKLAERQNLQVILAAKISRLLSGPGTRVWEEAVRSPQDHPVTELQKTHLGT